MIVAAAIMFYGELWTLPRPARHHDIIKAHDDVMHIGGSGNQGFIDDQGVFLSRRSAANHVLNCRQTLRRHPPSQLKWGDELFSEDLW